MVDQGELKGSFLEFHQKIGRKILESKYEIVSYGDIFEKLTNGLDERNYSDNGIYEYIRVSNIKNGNIDKSDIKKVNGNFTRGILSNGNFLITRKGTVGQSTVYDNNTQSIASSEVFIIQLKSSISPYFLNITNQLDFVQNQFKEKSTGAIMPSISQESLKTIQVPLPSLEIQQQIVDLMDQALATKQSKEAQAQELLDSVDSYVMQELGIEYEEVEEKQVFSILSTDINTENFSVGFYNTEKPQSHTDFVSLESVAEINPSRKIDDAEKYPYVGMPNTDDGQINSVEFRTRKEIGSGRLAFKDDILFARIEPSIFNKKYIFADDIKGYDSAYVSGEFIVIKSKGDINQKYLYYMLFRDVVYQQFAGKTTGSTGRRRLDLSVLKKIQIPLPPRDIQDKIADEVQSRISRAQQLQSEAEQIYHDAKQKVEEMVLSN